MLIKKPDVLLDVDGILADFTKAALRLVFQVTGRQYSPNDVKTWDIFDSIPEAEAKTEVYKRMKAPGGCMGIPVYEGAREGMRELRKITNSVIAVTAPFSGSPTWVYEREMWLAEHFAIDRNDVISTDQKFRVHGDILAEDKVLTLESWHDYWVTSGRDPYCVAAFWARDGIDTNFLPRVETWQDLLHLVETFRRG